MKPIGSLNFALFWRLENNLIDSGFRGTYEDCDSWGRKAKDYWRSQGQYSPTLQGRIEKQTKDANYLIIPVFC